MSAATDYARAFSVAVQWLHTARDTGSQRHLDTAVSCCRIARERFAHVEVHHLTEHERLDLARLQATAQWEVDVDEMAQHIVECRAALHAGGAQRPAGEADARRTLHDSRVRRVADKAP